MAAAGSKEIAALVVGAGPVGLAMASQLARHGVPCRLVDKAAEPSGNSRAVVLQARTLELFDNMGIVGEALARGVQIHAANFYADGRRVVHIAIGELDTPYPFILDLPQAETERLLRDYLGTFGVQAEWGVELAGFSQDATGVTATLRHQDGGEETLRPAWIVGCDGAHSTVRHTLGLTFEGEALAAGFAVGDFKVDWDLPEDEYHEFLHPKGLLVTFPMGHGRQRLIVEAEAYGGTGELPQPTLADFQAWMAERGPAGATVSDPAWMTPFRINERRVSHYRVGRAFVAGDAAHIHSPAGGQGMNTGLQDAFNLAWKIGLVHAGQAPDALLDSYEAERQPVAKALVEATTQMSRFITLRHPLELELRNKLMTLLAQQEVIQQRAVRWMSELPINYRRSPIVAEHAGSVFGRLRFGGGPRPGDRAPDAGPREGPDGSTLQLFDLLRGTRHTLLVFAGPEPSDAACQRADQLAEAIAGRYGDRINVVQALASADTPVRAPTGGSAVVDADLTLHHRYGADEECLYLIRPDGYVGYRGQPLEQKSLLDYLGRILT
jgi:2-polyprenyl-6-methoxyphenol hydroxylase-like FAD-dependent oxidoreductase